MRSLHTLGGEPWFVAADVAKILGYRSAPDMTRRLDEDEKGYAEVRTPGGPQQMAVITEAGLYSAIFGSQVRKRSGLVWRSVGFVLRSRRFWWRR